MIRLGIIGCGAVAAGAHLPAARVARDVKIVALADKDLARARRLQARFGIPFCTEDYHQFLKRVDGVIVALPNHLHAPVGRELLELRMPVLVEKPIAFTAAAAEALVRTARDSGVPLFAGHTYRYSRAARLTKRIIDSGLLGQLTGFYVEFGRLFAWPTVSGFFWKRDQAGGGVLIDKGSHTVDLLHWWLGRAADVEYWDDSLGGVEAECRLSLVLETSAGRRLTGHVLLSRLRRLGTFIRIDGEQCSLEFELKKLTVCLLPRAGETPDLRLAVHASDVSRDSFARMYAEQLGAFARAIEGGPAMGVSGEEVVPTVALIERCYRQRKPLTEPWLRSVDPAPSARA